MKDKEIDIKEILKPVLPFLMKASEKGWLRTIGNDINSRGKLFNDFTSEYRYGIRGERVNGIWKPNIKSFRRRFGYEKLFREGK